jgi:DNA primase catalytic core
MAKSRLKGTTLKVGGFLEEFEKDSIRETVDIVKLFNDFGVNLEKKGNTHMGCCPWHEDKTPSLSVDRTKGLYNCFGCGESGDVFNLVMKMKGLDFKEASKYLKGLARTNNKPLPVNNPESLSKVESFKSDLKATTILSKVRDYYHKELQSNPKALSYLSKRGLHDNSLIKHYNIGYSSGSLVSKLSDNQIELLKELGILNDKGKEVLEGYLTFPLTSPLAADVVGFYGRAIDNRTKVKHKYLKGEHKGLLNAMAVKVYSEELILTESILDALSLKKLGIDNILPCYGVNGFVAPHLKILKEKLVKKIVIAFDSDESGKSGAKNLKEKLLKDGFAVKDIIPPMGKDWNDYLLSGGNKNEIIDLVKTQTFEESKDSRAYEVNNNGNKYSFIFKEVTYRLVGVKDIFVSNLRVNIKAEREGKSYLDNVDLYSARSRTGFIDRLASTLDLNSSVIEKELVQIIEYLEEVRDRALIEDEDREIILTEEDKELGLSFLKNPNMFEEIVNDTEKLGYVGEGLNKQLIYLAASSRLLDDPISVTVISESASGKSYLIDTIKKLIPDEDVISITTLSDQALNYLPKDALIHKFMVMGEAVHSDIIDHQIREMLSSKELSRLVTTKDEKSGKMLSKTVRKDVVVSTVMSSTKTDINPENASRVFVINTDESVEQTRRIHSKQREKYSLKRYKSKAKDIPNIIRKHKSAQRMLKNILIVNNFVEYLSFPEALMRTRRDHERFIDLISTVCFLRQYQKETKEEVIENEEVKYIVCDLDDYKIAHTIMIGILSATLMNLPKGALTLYEKIRGLAKSLAIKQGVEPEEIHLSQREIREVTGLSNMFVKNNIRVLADYEYIIKSTSSRGKRCSYRLIKDEDINLIDISVIPSVDDMSNLIKKGVNFN